MTEIKQIFLRPEDLKIENIDVNRLYANKWNSNTLTAEQERQLEASIIRHSVVKPMLVRELPDKKWEVLGGQHRIEACKRLKFETVPVINLGFLPDQQAKEISLIDNARYGDDDPLKLMELIKDIGVDKDELQTFIPLDEASLSMALAINKTEFDVFNEDDDYQGLLNGANVDDEMVSPLKTHTMLRFSVPVEDAQRVEDLINTAMKEIGARESNHYENSGLALLALLFDRKYR